MTHVNSGFSVLCLLHTDTNLPTGLSTFSPSSLQSRVLRTKRFSVLKLFWGAAPCTYSKLLSGSPLTREERPRFCPSSLLWESPSRCLIQHFLSPLEQTFVDSGWLASLLFSPFAPGSPHLGDHLPTPHSCDRKCNPVSLQKPMGIHHPSPCPSAVRVCTWLGFLSRGPFLSN